MKLAQAVSSGITDLELDEKFKCGLIRTLFKAPCHLFPMVLKDVGTSAARASRSAPQIDAADECFVLLAGKPTWKLDVQLLEELRGVDVGEFLQSAANDRPRHTERLDAGLARLRVTGFGFSCIFAAVAAGVGGITGLSAAVEPQ
ncbi:hypothetical protein [Mesorhizobium sp. M0676]|uniref:hypothetical protein n=1 Tax=Mesorhizobium sp. M0676 TaxID=2956984 RepID=UPI003339DD22